MLEGYASYKAQDSKTWGDKCGKAQWVLHGAIMHLETNQYVRHNPMCDISWTLRPLVQRPILINQHERNTQKMREREKSYTADKIVLCPFHPNYIVLCPSSQTN